VHNVPSKTQFSSILNPLATPFIPGISSHNPFIPANQHAKNALGPTKVKAKESDHKVTPEKVDMGKGGRGEMPPPTLLSPVEGQGGEGTANNAATAATEYLSEKEKKALDDMEEMDRIFDEQRQERLRASVTRMKLNEESKSPRPSTPSPKKKVTKQSLFSGAPGAASGPEKTAFTSTNDIVNYLNNYFVAHAWLSIALYLVHCTVGLPIVAIVIINMLFFHGLEAFEKFVKIFEFCVYLLRGLSNLGVIVYRIYKIAYPQPFIWNENLKKPEETVPPDKISTEQKIDELLKYILK